MSDLLEKAKALNRSQKFEEAIELLKPELSGDHSEETLAVFCSSLASVSKYEEGVALPDGHFADPVGSFTERWKVAGRSRLAR